MSVLYPRGPIDLGRRARVLPADGAIPTLAGWRWIHTPGHTARHVSLFRERDRALIIGDAFCTTKQESFFAVATQRPAIIAPSHGQPIAGEDAAPLLAQLSAHFTEVAVPPHGRYVQRD